MYDKEFSSMEEDNNHSPFANNEEEYLEHQILMIIEEAPWEGNLAHCHKYYYLLIIKIKNYF